MADLTQLVLARYTPQLAQIALLDSVGLLFIKTLQPIYCQIIYKTRIWIHIQGDLTESII